ncbi:MAG: hypothetical protein PHY47_26270 [Lachnospiraceae bacterium]|nr:hypothetical protein [Lachnospiraceae bacterium]
MGLEDREWFREDHKRREKEYGGDFSLHSKRTRPENHQSNYINQRIEWNIITIIVVLVLSIIVLRFFKMNPKIGMILAAFMAITDIYYFVSARKDEKTKHIALKILNVFTLIITALSGSLMTSLTLILGYVYFFTS